MPIQSAAIAVSSAPHLAPASQAADTAAATSTHGVQSASQQGQHQNMVDGQHSQSTTQQVAYPPVGFINTYVCSSGGSTE